MEYFSIGRVFSRAFGLIRDSYASVGLFVLIIVVVEALIDMAAQPAILSSMQSTGAGGAAALGIFESTWYWLSLAASLLGLGLGWAGGIHGLLQQAWKGSTDLASCLRAAITGFVPTTVLIVLWWLGVAVGWMFIVVPALMLISMWAVAVPAMIGEGIGVFESFGRSRFLTRDHRLQIFGVLFLLLISYYALALSVAGSVMGTGMFTGAPDLARIGKLSSLMMLVSIPISWISGMLVKAVVVSLYLETVLVKEGSRTSELSDVFD